MGDYAINVADATEMEELERFLVGNFLTEEKIDTEPGRVDGLSVVLGLEKGPLGDRIVNKLTNKYPAIRVYKKGPRGGWNKVKS